MKYLLVLLAATQLSFADSLPFNLSKTEIETLNKDSFIIKTKKVKNLPWPEVQFYQKINTTSLEAAAVFSAFEHQKNYIPNLIKSHVVSQKSPVETHVEYEMEMPWPLSNSKYLHGHLLTYSEKEGYKVKWWMEKSNSTEKVEGSAVFHNYNGTTLMKYSSLVIPKSFIAPLIKSLMLKDLQKSMLITKKEIERVKRENKDLLRKYVSFINDALSGKFTYKKKLDQKK